MRAFAVKVFVAIDRVVTVAFGADDVVTAPGAQETGTCVAFEIFPRSFFIPAGIPLVRIMTAGAGDIAKPGAFAVFVIDLRVR